MKENELNLAIDPHGLKENVNEIPKNKLFTFDNIQLKSPFECESNNNKPILPRIFLYLMLYLITRYKRCTNVFYGSFALCFCYFKYKTKDNRSEPKTQILYTKIVKIAIPSILPTTIVKGEMMNIVVAT